MLTRILTRCGAVLALALVAERPAAAQLFQIKVVDAATSRGVPMVELKPQGGAMVMTDSNGIAVLTDAALLDRTLFVGFQSYGYTEWGQTVDAAAGGTIVVPLERRNRAERLYRVTGQDIYGHSVAAGVPTPIARPQLNAHVTGQDSVQTAVYKGQIYWFWGDTWFDNGGFNFRTSGARSQLPGSGGLDPAVGVNLNYFVTNAGFAKGMMPMSEPGLVWVDGLFTARDDAGVERLLTRYSRITPTPEDQFHLAEHGLALFNDSTQTFERFRAYPVDAPITPVGHSFRRVVDGEEFIYFGHNYPNIRVRADWAAITDIAQWEAFTPLLPNARYDAANPPLELDGQGNPVFGWKANADPLDAQMVVQLAAGGHIARDESPFRLEDHATGRDLWIHRAAVSWNEYRQNWIMIGEEFGGDSALGELWLAEAPAPEGPWTDAVKVVSHNRSPNQDYTFYNPALHPYFDQDGGRYVYFEGTYTDFLAQAAPTPPYNYNQVMYRLDLATIPLLAAAETDYDGDGDGAMDGGDFLAWQRAAGRQVFAGAGPDGVADGSIDAADLNHWAAEFGPSAGDHHAAPEPSGVAPALGAGAALYGLQRRQGRR